ncbi:MAG: 3-mercaptopyruvate sulfurtransferase [Parvularculaceae bacterium]
MTDASLPTPLVTTDWLARHLDEKDLVIIDASWRMPGQGHALDDFRKRHIAGAVFFDIDEIADQSTDLPHMLPTPEEFGSAVGKLGVANSDRIVVYDDKGVFSAARGWWTFKAMGHGAVAVLNGGLPKWISEGRPTTDEPSSPQAKAYRAALRPERVADAQCVREALEDAGAKVLDARPAGRFLGAEPEPRSGLRRGRMPGAESLPWTSLVAPDNTLRAPAELMTALAAAGVNPGRRIITTCGSGVTAAILSLALEAIGHSRHGLYDGSWAEWGDEKNDPRSFPVEAGAR